MAESRWEATRGARRAGKLLSRQIVSQRTAVTANPSHMVELKARMSLRVDFGETVRLGPGKVRLLELIAELGSISAAGRAMDMSYRRAWLLVDSLNQAFVEPVVATRPGGKADQRAEVTQFGQQIVRRFRAMEATAREAVGRDLRTLEGAIRPNAEVRWMRDPRDGRD
jgi:molybdate transport system regulatory protein